MLCRVSLFHKEITEKKKVKDMVLMNAFLVAYWIAKEETANHKFSSLVNLFKIVSPENMKFFSLFRGGDNSIYFLSDWLNPHEKDFKQCKESRLPWVTVR